MLEKYDLKVKTTDALNAVLFMVDPAKLGDLDPKQLGIGVRTDETRFRKSAILDYVTPVLGSVALFDYAIIIDDSSDVAIIYNIVGTTMFGYALLNPTRRVVVPITPNELVNWFMPEEDMSYEDLEKVSDRIIEAAEQVAIIEDDADTSGT